MSRRLLALALGLSLATPAIADPVEALAPPDDARFTGGRADPVPATPWWEQLGDDRLTEVVRIALARNPDLRRSRAAVTQAEGSALSAAAGFLPAVSASARTTVAPTDSLGFQFGGLPQQPGAPEPPSTYSQGSATLDADWNLDVFGSGVASWQAATRESEAARQDLAEAGVGTVEQVVGAYLDVATARERLAIVDAQIGRNEELLEVLDLRYQRGDSTSLDVLQQRQQLATTQAQRPSADLLLRTSEQRLAVLMGELPLDRVPTADTLPGVPGEPAVGTPADLVRHRPDLRAAEARLRSARDRRWAATTSLLPTVGVSATAGWQYFDLAEFSDQTYWNAGANITVPLFNGGRTLGQIRQARGVVEAQEAAYRGTVLRAVQDVEAALAQEAAQAEAVAAYQAQLDAADAAYQAARRQYLDGLTTWLNVQSTLGTRQSAELQLLQGRRDLWSARISLHQALGGSWTTDLAQSAEAAP
jgi:NodT family efflux transporter outer membrane factor (OMF) lipoprotein